MAFATTIKEFRDTSWRQYQNDIFIAKSWEKNHLAWGKYMGIPACVVGDITGGRPLLSHISMRDQLRRLCNSVLE
jgi:hypothetical protein